MKVPNKSNRVFISSTVYDLVDVRAEVENILRDLGLTPVMSDSKNDGFDSTIQTNSIDTCLINLKSCGIVILILSQRYGPSLKKHGFSDHSATHLEYLEAKKEGIPTYVYARDRLLADHAVWKRSTDKNTINYVWIDKKDHRIFEIIEERSKLATHHNWISSYTDSVDLKCQIKRDIKLWADSVTFWKDLEENKVPMFYPNHYCEQINERMQWKFKRIIKNCGSVAATDVVIKDVYSKAEETVIMIPPGEAVELNVLVDSSIPVSDTKELFLEYKDLKGRSYIDVYESNINGGPKGIRTGFKLKIRKYIDSNGKERVRDF
jgi:hypothetical protein